MAQQQPNNPDSPYAARDYSLTGPEALSAHEKGLVSAVWYQCAVPRKRLKALMQRRNGPAVRDTALWLLALVLSGYGGYYFWGGAAASHSLLSTAFYTALRPTLAGMKPVMARRSKPAG